MHFEYGSCDPGEYVDFSLTLQASDYHYNYLIEVEDLSEGRGTNPTALKLFLYEDISEFNRREAEHRAERAVDGVYSVEINVHNFHAGISYFAVQCTEAPRRFRTVVYQVESHVQLGQEYHGEVCPGAWVYHYVEQPATETEPADFIAHVVKHTGDVDIVVRHGYLPVKLVPPYEYMGETEEVHDTYICKCYPGERIYIGMLGGLHLSLIHI